MRDEIQAYLDGEIPREELPEDLRADAGRWDRLLDEMRSTAPERAPTDLGRRVMAELPDRPDAPWWHRAWEWIVRPRTVRVSPLGAAMAAAVLALAVAVPSGLLETGGTPGDAGAPAGGGSPATVAATGGPEAESPRVYLQFRLEAPDARSVAVAGDFTNWEPRYYLSDADGDGVWTGRVPLSPGVHEYMYVVNGSRWVTDPGAERYSDDGFGNRNAVVTITRSST